MINKISDLTGLTGFFKNKEYGISKFSRANALRLQEQ